MNYYPLKGGISTIKYTILFLKRIVQSVVNPLVHFISSLSSTSRRVSPKDIGKNRRHLQGYWEYNRIEVKHGQEMVWSSPPSLIDSKVLISKFFLKQVGILEVRQNRTS